MKKSFGITRQSRLSYSFFSVVCAYLLKLSHSVKKKHFIVLDFLSQMLLLTFFCNPFVWNAVCAAYILCKSCTFHINCWLSFWPSFDSYAIWCPAQTTLFVHSIMPCHAMRCFWIMWCLASNLMVHSVSGFLNRISHRNLLDNYHFKCNCFVILWQIVATLCINGNLIWI